MDKKDTTTCSLHFRSKDHTHRLEVKGYKKIFHANGNLRTGVSSVQSLSCVQLFVTPWTQAHQTFCPSPTPRACSNSCPSSWWCHPTISSFVILFSSCLQSFPASVSFPVSQFFTSGGIRWPKYWSFSFSISPSNEYSGLISFGTDWFQRRKKAWEFFFFYSMKRQKKKNKKTNRSGYTFIRQNRKNFI